MRAVRHFTPELKHPIPPLSYAARAGDLIFVSGLPGLAPDGSLAISDFSAQFSESIATLHSLLLMFGADLSDIIKANVFLTRASDIEEMNRLYAGTFPQPFPARTTVVVNALPHPDMLIEIEYVLSARSNT